MIKAQTLKGFRDFLPSEARKRQFVISTLKSVFESYGFEPLETPALEYEEILTGKYGNESDKLMYKFKDNGQRKVALRYDQTVPLARVAAQYANEITLPFKRYQIQNVWRAENPQKGRYREFLQCDVDIIGSNSPVADAEVIKIGIEGLSKLGFKNIKAYISDRNVKNQIKQNVEVKEDQIPFIFRSIDKITKLGKERVLKELEKEFSREKSEYILNAFKNAKPTENIETILKYLKSLGVNEEIARFDPFLARGLDYYTGTIVEIDCKDYDSGSLIGGGRFDNLIGIFTKDSIPAVGIAFGFDRIIDAMEDLNLFPEFDKTKSVLVSFSSEDQKEKTIEIACELRNKNISAEVYLGETSDKNLLEKQLKYADKKQIPYVLIINDERLVLKDMKKRQQKNISMEQLIDELKQ